jgi:hypothetical protein
LALASGHDRYITVTPERALVSVGEWPLHIAVAVINLYGQPFHFRSGYVTVIYLLKPPCGSFRIETATWIQKWFEISVATGTSREL